MAEGQMALATVRCQDRVRMEPVISINASQVTPALKSLFDPNMPTGIRCLAVLDGGNSGKILTDDPDCPHWGTVWEADDGTLSRRNTGQTASGPRGDHAPAGWACCPGFPGWRPGSEPFSSRPGCRRSVPRARSSYWRQRPVPFFGAG